MRLRSLEATNSTVGGSVEEANVGTACVLTKIEMREVREKQLSGHETPPWSNFAIGLKREEISRSKGPEAGPENARKAGQRRGYVRRQSDS